MISTNLHSQTMIATPAAFIQNDLFCSSAQSIHSNSFFIPDVYCNNSEYCCRFLYYFKCTRQPAQHSDVWTHRYDMVVPIHE